MKTSTLAKAIARDLLRERSSSTTTAVCCFSCGRSFMPRRLEDADDNGRFCSARCRKWLDAGNPAYDPNYASKSNPSWYSLPLGKHGFLVPCANCGKTFDSKGLRCCSTECERGLGERREVERLKAESGVEFESKLGPKRKCQNCGGDIPRWRNGKQVSKATRFCTPKCQRAFSNASKKAA